MTATTEAAPAALPSIEEGQKLIARFALLSARQSTIEADLAKAIAPLKATADKKLAPIESEMASIKASVEPWFFANRGELLAKGKKSVELSGCVIGSRLGPKRLVLPGTDDEAIDVLQRGRFHKLIKRVFQLDKKAISLRIETEPEGDVAKLGFSIAQADTFFIDPAVHTGRKS